MGAAGRSLLDRLKPQTERFTLYVQELPLTEQFELRKGGENHGVEGGRYTPEFELEAARLLESGQNMTQATRALRVVDQTLSSWVTAHRGGTLKGASGKPWLSAEQMERDIPGKATSRDEELSGKQTTLRTFYHGLDDYVLTSVMEFEF